MKFILAALLAGFCYASPTLQIKRQCGSPAIKPDTSTNIVGGKDAIPYSWPWQVGIFRSNGPLFNCGGTLIANQWIMTAAHCVINNIPKLYKVKLGVFNNTRDDEPGETVSNVAEIYAHRGYDFEKLINDIAVVKLSSPVEYTDHISPICLPNIDEELPAADTNVFTTGWGRVNPSNWESSRTLKQVLMPLMSTEKCKARIGYPKFDEKLHICAGFDEGGKGICHGDSGGPGMIQNEDGTWKQIGINCYVPQATCATAAGSGYTRVSAFVDYVKQYVKDLP